MTFEEQEGFLQQLALRRREIIVTAEPSDRPGPMERIVALRIIKDQ